MDSVLALAFEAGARATAVEAIAQEAGARALAVDESLSGAIRQLSEKSDFLAGQILKWGSHATSSDQRLLALEQRQMGLEEGLNGFGRDLSRGFEEIKLALGTHAVSNENISRQNAGLSQRIHRVEEENSRLGEMGRLHDQMMRSLSSSEDVMAVKLQKLEMSQNRQLDSLTDVQGELEEMAVQVQRVESRLGDQEKVVEWPALRPELDSIAKLALDAGMLGEKNRQDLLSLQENWGAWFASIPAQGPPPPASPTSLSLRLALPA